MVTTHTQGRVHAKESETEPEHIIFQICLKCHYNTLKPLDCAPVTTCGPGYRCPECQKSSFVTACTICRFESSAECPLTRLLKKRAKTAVPERRGRERHRKGDHGGRTGSSVSRSPAKKRPELCRSDAFDAPDMKKQCQDILKRFKSNGSKVHTAPQMTSRQKDESISPKSLKPRISPPMPQTTAPELPSSSLPKTTKAPQPPAPPREAPVPIEIPRVICTQCSQVRCLTCRPGFMNLVVDMKEFSTTFAEGMSLCTMCEHWLCPGSSLVVLYRCRDCGHEGCNECATRDDRLGDEWVDCCQCAKTKELSQSVAVGL